MDGNGIEFVAGSGSPSMLVTADYVQGRVHKLNATNPVSNITQLGPNRYGGYFDREHQNFVDVEAGVVYVADAGHASYGDTPPRVQSIPLAGGSFTDLYVGTLPDFRPDGIEVVGDTIYLTHDDRILQMPTSGGTPTVLTADERFENLLGLTYFDDALYAVDNGTGGDATVWKVDLTTPGGGITLQDTTFLGGAGDQYGSDIAIEGNDLYVVGRSGSSGLLARYDTSPSVPLSNPVLGGNTYFSGVAVSATNVYPVGGALPPACGASDNVGGTEHKTALARYNREATLVDCRSENFFSYRGGEGYSTAIVVNEGSGAAVYVAGGGEEAGFGGGRTILAKYAEDGTLLWKRKYATDENGNQLGGTSTRTGSATNGLAWLNGSLYLAGSDRGSPGPPYSPRAFPGQGMLLKYDAAAQLPDPDPEADGAGILVPEWARQTGFDSAFLDVAAVGGSLYAVGYANTGTLDYLIEKFDEDGTRLWSTTTGGDDTDVLTGVVGIGSRVFAVGYTKSEGAGGEDAVLLEIDPENGQLLPKTLFGGAQNDKANAVVTDGTDLYVVGESRSFTEGGNLVGQNDLLLLRYSLGGSPPGGTTDIRIHDVTADEQTTLTVSYEIVDGSSAPFDLGFYRSTDATFQPADELLSTVQIANPADLSVGQHEIAFSIGGGAGEVALPGAGAAETDDDYFLLAVADHTDAVAEVDADPFDEDNTTTFVGIYHPAGGGVFVHGSADSESLTVSPGSLRLEVDGEVTVYPGGDVTALRVRGHAGNDSFDFTYGAGFGTPGVFGVLVHGGAGEDSAELTGSPGDDTARVYPDSATFSGPGFQVSLSGTTEVTVHGGGGNDDASLYDSADNDVFVGSPHNGELSGPTFRSTAEGFNIIHAYGLASDDDSDITSIDDSSGNDKLKADSTYTKLYNSQFLVRAKGFGTTHVYARNGGHDTARLFDSDGNDKVKAGPDTTKIYGSGYFVRAKFFDEMTAYAGDGIDQIRFYDSAEVDKFVGTDAKSRMYSTVQKPGFTPYDNTGRNFDQVIAYSTEGGVDKARFFDTPGTDEFRGRSHKATFQGPGIDYTVRKFEEVYAFSTNGGNGIAKLHDTVGDDYLEARLNGENQNWAAMWAGDGKQDLLYDVTGFPRVKAYHSEGTDTAVTAVAAAGYVELVGDWQSAGGGESFMFMGTYPEPAAVTFTDDTGETMTAYAYPGQIEVFAASGVTADGIGTLVASLGGTILGQLPGSGYYLVGVNPGAEATFISAVNGHASVDWAAPHVPVTNGNVSQLGDHLDPKGTLRSGPIDLGAPVGTGVAMYYADDFTNTSTLSCGITTTHGDNMYYVGSKGLAGGGGRVDTSMAGRATTPGHRTTTAIKLFFRDSEQNDYSHSVINLSSSGAATDRAGRPLPAGQTRSNFYLSLRARAKLLDSLSDEQLEKTMIVTIVGNGLGNRGVTGLDLSEELNDLHEEFSRIFPPDGGHHLLVLGSTQANSSDPYRNFNYTSNPDDEHGNPLVIYGNGLNVPINSDGTCTMDGTSGAAAEVSSLLARSFIRHPDQTVHEVSKAFAGAYWRNANEVPTLDQIDDQFGLPMISIDNTEVNERDEGESSDAIFFVTLSKVTTEPITFFYGTGGGTADAGIDYHSVDLDFKTIPAGGLATTLKFEVFGDDETENDETFMVHLGDFTNARAGELHGTATIYDNDPPSVRIWETGGSTGVAEGGATDSYSILLSGAPSQPVTVNITPDSQVTTSRTSVTFDSTNWSRPQIVTVTAVDDSAVEDTPHPGLIAHSVTTTDQKFQGVSVGSVNVRIADNDDNTPVVGNLILNYSVSNTSTGASASGTLGFQQIYVDSGYNPPVPGRYRLKTDTGGLMTELDATGVVFASNPYRISWGAGGPGAPGTGSLFFSLSGGIVTGESGLNFIVATNGNSYTGGGVTNGTFTPSGAPLMAEFPPAAAEDLGDEEGSARLTQESLESIVAAASVGWNGAGLHDGLQMTDRVHFQIVDLPGGMLGLATPQAILIDRNAAGHGWFVDSTPERDEEFRLLGDAGLSAVDDGPAAGRVDLLTVVLHEMGHMLGLDDLDPLDDPDNLMNEILPPGIRRLPSPSTVDEIFADDPMAGMHHGV